MQQGHAMIEADAVLDLLEDYAHAWRINEQEAIAGHWAPERFLFYKAEEIPHFFHAWDDVVAYWGHNEGLHDTIVLRFREPEPKGLAEDLVVADVGMRWDIRFADNATLPDGAAFPHRGECMGGNNHVVVFLCGTPNGWKICGWSETPNAAISYMRSLYFANADRSVLENPPSG